MPYFGIHPVVSGLSRCGVVPSWLIYAVFSLLLSAASGSVLTTTERAALAHEQFIESRRESLKKRLNPYIGPRKAQVVEELPGPWSPKRNPWHHKVRATIFWVGEQPSERNPTPNTASSWDPHWEEHFGGYDHPRERRGFFPAAFEPKLNPFYIALPNNDLLRGRAHRPEASEVIAWFWSSYRGPGVSVCHNRWVAIHRKGRVAYAQWKDVGPFAIDDWPYVFLGRSPRANANQNAGIDISPAVRDFLRMRGKADVDWRFVEEYEVPPGPWGRWISSPATTALPETPRPPGG